MFAHTTFRMRLALHAAHVRSALLLSLAVIVFGLVVGTGFIVGAGATGASFSPTLSVYFLDVDQGDATLFVGEDFTILIDAGRHERAEVVPLLQSVGVKSIDLFIATHPHADHIGQCAAVMRNFAVGEVWMSGDTHTTLTFERCLDAIIDSDAGYYEPRAGETFQIGSARIEVVHPAQVTGHLNNGSIGVRIIYDNVAFLLTGDAEIEAERAMLERGHDLNAHIMKLGHHGSRTSSTDEFLRGVQPELAVYSAGGGNTYGHPHAEALRTIEGLGITLFGTDVNGTIRVDTDGKRYDVVPERGWAVMHGTAVAATGQVAGDMSGGAGILASAGNPASGGGGSGILASGSSGAAAHGCGPGQVDINTAAAAELTRIIHIGPAMAARVMDARPFHSIEDLVRVSGIAERRLLDMKEQGLACVSN